MILQKIRIYVETNKNVKFIASLPSTQAIKNILPILLNKYSTVVRQNYDAEEYNLQELKANYIRQIKKDGYLIPLDEQVRNILNNDDNVFIQTNFLDKNQKQSKITKKERLQMKKQQKKNIQQHSKNNDFKETIKVDQSKIKASEVIQEKQAVSLLKAPSLQIAEKKEKKSEENPFLSQNFNKLLSKIRIKSPKEQPPKKESKNKVMIVQESDSDE